MMDGRINGKIYFISNAGYCGLSNNFENSLFARDEIMRKVLLTIALLVLAMPAFAQEKSDEQLRKEYEGVAWEKAHEVKGQYYTVKCNSTEEVARRYSTVLDKLVSLYNTTFPNLYTKKMTWDAWIYKTRREFIKRHAKKARVTAGYYFPGDKRIYTYHGLFGVSGSTFNILAHEGMHAFQHSFLKSYFETPIWLLEGMAVMCEGVEVKEEGKLELDKPPRDRVVQLKVELNEGKMMHLSDVVGENAKPFTRRAYAYAGLFVWWLAKVEGRQKKVLDELLTILSTRGYQKNDLENLLQSHLGKDLKKVEQEWRNWLRKMDVEYTGRKIAGGTYTSKLLHFTIKRPKSDWVMDGEKAPVNGECIVFQRKSTGGRISVTVYINQLPLYADELYMQWLSDLEESVGDLEIESKERLELKGHTGFRIRYAGTEPGSRITTDKQKVEISAVVTMRHIYVIRAQSPPEKWERNRADFARTFERFKLIK